MRSLRITAIEKLVCAAIAVQALTAGALGLVTPEAAVAYVRETEGTNATNVVLYSPAEAAKVIDTVFKSNRRDEEQCPDWELERMKHLVDDGLAVLIGYDDVEHERSDWEKTFATCAYRLVHRFRDRDKSEMLRNDEEIVTYHPRADYCYDEVVLRKQTGERVYGLWGMTEAPEKVALLFGPDRKVGLDNRVGTNVEVSVIADVETVTLSSVSGLEKIVVAGGVDGGTGEQGLFPVGHYRVSLLVRTALVGDAPANRLVFTAKTGAKNATVGGHWLFYRGMTLKVGLRKTKDGFSICRLEPVLPYPPYTTDDVVVCGKDVPPTSRFSLFIRFLAAVDHGGVTVLYGDHTRADYFSLCNLIEGHCGILPDFGGHSWVYVLTHGKDSKLDYWRNAWFADEQDLQVSLANPGWTVPLFRPAVEAFFLRHDERLRFNWWNLVFPSVSFKSPATMKDVADFLTLAARPCSCTDDVAYRVVADPDVAARPVRPLSVSDVGAWEVLRRVASENGCAIKVDGTNVTLSAELTDEEVASPRVDELAAKLEKEGFGSTAGARYANVSFWMEGVNGGRDAEEVVSAVSPYRAVDVESRLEGNGWVRTAADGTEQFLAYDAAWWDGVKECEPIRLRRDILRSLDTLNLLADGAFGFDGWCQDEIDSSYRALALHAAQAGFKSEGQQLLDALWRRPAAAKKALAKLRERFGRPEAKCRTSHDWYEMMRAKGKAESESADEAENEEEDDESDAD